MLDGLHSLDDPSTCGDVTLDHYLSARRPSLGTNECAVVSNSHDLE